MSSVVCRYAIVRFVPDLAREEFANIGILMANREKVFFGLSYGVGMEERCEAFFPGFNVNAYRGATRALMKESHRIIVELRNPNNLDKINDYFEHMVKPRESIIQFGSPRVLMTNDPLEDAKEKLLAQYINMN